MGSRHDVPNKNRTANEKVAYWRNLIDLWQDSKLSQQEFCESQQVNLATFTYWRAKFIAGSGKKKQKKLIPLQIPDANVSSSLGIRIQLPNQVQLAIPRGTDETELRMVLTVIGMVR